MRAPLLLAAMTFTLFQPRLLQAQVPWEAPFMVSPASPPGLSVVLADPGAGLGVILLWAGRGGPVRVGYRVGLAEAPGDDVAILGGVDVSGLLTAHSVDFPLDLVWVSGVGVGISGDALLTVPLGISMGRVVVGEGLRVHPYVTPRMVVDAYLGNHAGNGDEMDLRVAVDLGVDLAFQANWMIRMAGTVGGGREAVGIGIAFPFVF